MQDVLDDKLALVSLSFGMFGGYRRATEDHIKKLGGKLPKSNAITEGSIKIFPCDGLKEFGTIRRAVFRDLGKIAIKALDSRSVFAVNRDDLAKAEKAIADAAANYAAETAVLDASYDALFEKHVAANPEAEAIIRSLKVDRTVAISKCHFTHHIFRIEPFVREGENRDEGVVAIVRGLGRQLFEEVAAELEKLEENDAFKRAKVGQKSLRPIKAAIEKMSKFTFLDPAVQGAIDLVESTLGLLPREGYIEGPDFKVLQRLVSVMSDADNLVNAASKVKNGIPSAEVLFPPPVVQAVIEPEQVVELESVVAQAQTVLPETVAAPIQSSPPVKTVVAPPPVVQQQPAPVLRQKAGLRPNALMF